jgi:hypothetical protein
MFKPAERKKQRLRLALIGPAGSGKTLSALRIAAAIGGPIAVADSEHGSAELYAGQENPDGGILEFDVVRLDQMPGQFKVENYLKAIDAAADYPVLIIDSLSHAWAGPGGIMEFVDRESLKSKGNKYVAWGKATPLHNRLIAAMLAYPGHLIVTMRTKMAHVQEKDDRGRTVIRKVGMQPIQRDGLEYEFTAVGDFDQEGNVLTISKTRCSAISEGRFPRPGAAFAGILLDWLDSGRDRTALDDAVTPAQMFAAALAEHGLDVEKVDAWWQTQRENASSVLTWTDEQRAGLLAGIASGEVEVSSAVDIKQAAP